MGLGCGGGGDGDVNGWSDITNIALLEWIFHVMLAGGGRLDHRQCTADNIDWFFRVVGRIANARYFN
jgi:hypothetical protein